MVSMNELKSLKDQWFKVSFRVTGDELEPSEISKILEMEPTISHKKGDANMGLSKKGKVINYAPHRTGLWSLESGLPETNSLEKHILWLVERLDPVKNRIGELAKGKYKIEFFCGYFFSNHTQAGIELSSITLERINGLGADLAICMYVV